jgi:filamentous hemagglutinin family protein
MTVKFRSLRNTLLLGASLGSLVVAGAAQAQNRGGFGNRGGTADPGVAATQAAQAQAARAAQASSASQRAIQALRRAAEARTAMSAAQQAARAAALATQSNAPNGIGKGGLQVATGVVFGPDGKPLEGGLWIGANGPVQASGQGGRTSVTVDQTQAKAILSWDSFSVGRETDLAFRQGGSDWVVLNRVTGASADPSRILGTIKAPGAVYVLNRNGVLFGGTSQINVRSLIASSANIADADFLVRGIYSQQASGNYLASFKGAGGAVTVEAGAQIATDAPTSVTAGGGFVLLMGSSVSNKGAISTPRGQTVLAAGDDFIIRPGYGTGAGTTGNANSTTRGNEVRGLVGADSASGSVVNAGQIEAAQGDITLAGRTIRQDGVLVSTTGVNQRGTIHLLNSASDTKGSVTLGKGSLTLIAPELDSKDTALDGQRDTLIKQSNQGTPLTGGGFDDRATLADRLDQSRVEIVTGGNVLFEGGSQTMAQGSQVAVQADRGRITVANGASIDVSGVMGVALDMERNSIKVNVQGNELRDSPANRESSGLKSQDVWIDVRDLVLLPSGTGGYEGDRWYTPGGLLEVGGYLANISHGIGEWAAVGGSITLSAKEVVAQKGAVFDVSGGSIDYQAGWVRSTRILGADGKMYDVRNAPANLRYVAIGDAFRRQHDRWGEQYAQTFTNPLFSRGTRSRWEEGYSIGRDAGALILSAPTVVMEGDVLAEVLNGEHQINARAAGVTDGYKAGQHTRAQAGALVLGRYNALTGDGVFATDVQIGDVADITAGLGTADALPKARTGTAWFDAGRLNAAQLGGLKLETAGTIAITKDIKLADGGALTVTAPRIDIAASVTAHGGSVTATNWFTGGFRHGVLKTLLDADGASSITLREGATLDLRGLWVNVAQNAADQGKLSLIDGGSVYLASTHDVTLAKGSRIDVSSGAGLLALGETQGGKGGSVTLIADLETGDTPDANGLLTLDGKIAAFGVRGSGTLKIETGTAVEIGGTPIAPGGVLAAGVASPVELVLDADYAVKAGEPLPIDYAYTVAFAQPGEEVGPSGVKQYANYTIAKDWVPPALGEGYTFRVNGQGQYYVEADGTTKLDGQVITSIPGGSTIEFGYFTTVFAGYTFPADAFPDPLPLQPYVKTVRAGQPAPVDVTVAKGSIFAANVPLPRDAAVKANTTLDTALFQSGFASYDVNGRTGVSVAAGTTLDVAAPALRGTRAAASVASGGAPGGALEWWTPPLYQEDPIAGVLTQRAGADLTLRSSRLAPGVSTTIGFGGPIAIGAGAVVSVDPGQSIDLAAYTVRVEGRLNAWGGAIHLGPTPTASGIQEGSETPGLLWVGEKAVLDAAARAATATDSLGNRYGIVARGGTISIGGALDWDANGDTIAPNGFVVIRKGALLDASGTSAVLDQRTGSGARPVTVASDGGAIVLKSANNLYVDGTLRAAAGGAGAAGGALGVALAPPNYTVSALAMLDAREIVLSATQGDVLSVGVGFGDAFGVLRSGQTRLGADKITAGGFDSLSLLVDGVLSFDGNVTLGLDQSVRLYAGGFALAKDAASGSKVQFAAPQVRLAGTTRVTAEGYVIPNAGWASGNLAEISDARFAVQADLIELRDTVGFGASTVGRASAIQRRGFGDVDLSSTGDLRFLQGIWRKASGAVSPEGTYLETLGNLTLTAAQIYPATDTVASATAGYLGRFNSDFRPDTALTIRRSGSGDVPMPYSAFGFLQLKGGTINQGGIVRAPFGSIALGGAVSAGSSMNTGTRAINLLAGSITSVSGVGLVMPYGGTVDGVQYQYAGTDLDLSARGGVFGKVRGAITLDSASVSTAAGSVIDLSGGGELTGAGFVSGRGGSVDILRAPFVTANPGYGFSDAGNAVYAIVPTGAGYAPVAADMGAGAPLAGRQITVPAGVPGLAAGTYMLMPSTYALLPGAFRVEIGAGNQNALGGVTDLGNGSYTVAGTLGVAHSDVRDALPSKVIVTPASVVRTHSAYNETSYDAWLRSDAARNSVPRATSVADAASLTISLGKPYRGTVDRALSIAGEIKQAPLAKSDGFGAVISVHGIGEVRDAGQTVATDLAGVSVFDDDLNALNASRLMLNASMGRTYGPLGRFVEITGDALDLTVRSGAMLTAGDVILGGRRQGSNPYRDTTITIEEGASILARSGGAHVYDSSDGFLFSTEGAVVVSNGSFNLLLTEAPNGVGNTGLAIRIGACATDACATPTQLIAGGSLALATNRTVTIADNVSYGAKDLVLGVSSVNLGESGAIAAAGTAGQLPEGLELSQSKLAALLNGNTASGAPKVETLVLNARDAVNIYGAVDLDASGVQRLVFGAPAIYGYGAASDVATIRAGEFVWTGADRVPGAPVAAALGHGTLDVQAKSILFGYGPNTQPSGAANDARIALGFGQVRLTATDRFTASRNSSLAVYETRGGYDAGTGWRYGGGNLTLTAPLLTATGGAKFALSAGGDVAVLGGGQAALPTVADLGVQLSITGRNVTLDSAVVLPSGRLTVDAAGDIAFGGNARIDLAGREVTLVDVQRYSWGGDLSLASTGGDVTMAAGALVDLSAQNNRGGTMTVTALGDQAGRVELAGTIKGGATGEYDAGGTMVPYDAAELTVRAQTLADFAGLNARLNAGSVFGARRFQIKQGDLTVGDGVRAREVTITLDGGSLTVAGKIDASGFQPGTIRLAAMGDLTVTGTLDAHGTGLRVDSYGKVIDSPNRAIVALTSRAGTLTLADSAAIDLRAGTAAKNADGVARGTLDLNAARAGVDDVAINVLGTLDVQGAKSIAVNAFRTYADAPLAALPDVTGNRPQRITQAYLDGIDGDSRTFMSAALGNASLTGRLAGLGSFHLRPGVEIVSATPTGDLTVDGDLDLSGYRYGPGVNGVRGMGDPGVLVLRAGGNLNIHGSINDGFAPPPTTPDEDGWELTETRGANGAGVLAAGGDVVVPIDGVVLDTGTTYSAGVTLNYAIPVGATTLPAGTVLPVDAALTASLALSAGTVVDAPIYAADGSLAYAAGTVLANGVTLDAGMTLGKGTPLRTAASFAALTWPRGVKLPVAMATTGPITLARGSLIPSTTKLELVGDAPVQLRPADANGVQGRNWAVAPMLGEGATSWDMQLVAGADLRSADTRALNPLSSGAINLADTHNTLKKAAGSQLKLLGQAGVDVLVNLYGAPSGNPQDLLGLTEDEVIAAYGAFNWDDFGLPNFWDPASGYLKTGLTSQGLTTMLDAIGGLLPTGIFDPQQLLGKTGPELIALYADQGATSWDDFGLPGFDAAGNGNFGLPGSPPVRTVTGPAFSVVRTGTGDLSMLAAGDVRMHSLYGVYTAGTATRADAAYDLPRGTLSDGSVLGTATTGYDAALAGYHAWYPDQGGNLTITAGGDLIGDIRHTTSFPVTENGTTRTEQQLSTNLLGNWLWRQGSGSAATDDKVATSWWINFGSYARTFDDLDASTQEWASLNGFTGFGTLGGGNVTVRVGGDAGKTAARGAQSTGLEPHDRSQALVVAVGSTGRVGSDGTLTLTGGGDLDMRIAGALNPFGETNALAAKSGLGGSIVNVRGSTRIDAASVGQIRTAYPSNAAANPLDPRGADPFEMPSATALSGLTLIPGDGTVTVQTLGDMVIAGAGDPTRTYQINRPGFRWDGTAYTGGGNSWFSLWTDHSAINLLSAAGNMAPSTTGRALSNDQEFLNSDIADTWPAQLRIAALGGNIYYGAAARAIENNQRYTSDTLAPSPNGALEVLAAGSIYAGQVPLGAIEVARHGLVLSATGTALPTPFDPAFVGSDFATGRELTNLSKDGGAYSFEFFDGWNTSYSLFAFGPDSADTAARRDPAAAPIRIYAVAGDIIGLGTGQTFRPASGASAGRTAPIWYSAGAPVRMIAGRDIVSSGSFANNDTSSITIAEFRNLIVHSNTTDVSLVSAGRDILYSNFDVAGPGTLEVSAGRNVFQEDKGSFTSLGALAKGDTRPGASIAVMAGTANGVDWQAVRDSYLDPAKLANPAYPLVHPQNSGKVAKTYDKELIAWLGDRYGFKGDAGHALAAFDALAPEQQRIFLREVYFAETRAGGREYNDANGPRFGSYLRGRTMIATLFPDKDGAGKEITRSGDIILFDGSGIRTNFGGDIELLAPGGQIVVGVQGKVPPATAGIVTQGQGDIRIFSEKSLLLGLSRVMTTFGGDIFAWSEQGDINAGRGAKTTIVYTPPKRTYDAYGNVTLSPDAPSTGAGIATLNPIPEVAPGDVDLIAPLGTIDAGEAGIRVSGNVNLAALQVLNAANIQVKGAAAGIPQAVVVNTGALTAASSATSAVTAEASRVAERSRPPVRTEVPMIVTVTFVGFGQP